GSCPPWRPPGSPPGAWTATTAPTSTCNGPTACTWTCRSRGAGAAMRSRSTAIARAAAGSPTRRWTSATTAAAPRCFSDWRTSSGSGQSRSAWCPLPGCPTAWPTAAWPIRRGPTTWPPLRAAGPRLVAGAEVAYAPKTPLASAVGTGGSGDAGGLAWQLQASLYDFAPRHHIGIAIGGADAGWLLSPDYRPNDRSAEIRY